jgi:hypothetical protein
MAAIAKTTPRIKQSLQVLNRAGNERDIISKKNDGGHHCSQPDCSMRKLHLPHMLNRFREKY